MQNLSQKAIDTATLWMDESIQYKSEFELNLGKQVHAMLANKRDKLLLVELLDSSFRATNPKRASQLITYIFDKYGIADFFRSDEKFLVWLYLYAGRFVPEIALPFFTQKVRNDTKEMVIKGESKPLLKHIAKRRGEGMRVNLNVIGEAVLGEDEARHRINEYKTNLKREGIDYISIKASTIYSQINALAPTQTIAELVKRFSEIFAVARDTK